MDQTQSKSKSVMRLGSYELLRRFASGGMAELFLARALGPEGFQKLVVLKKILPEYADNERFVQLFLDEARLAASLDHPNIVNVFGMGTLGSDYFFAMEFVHGKDVSSVLSKNFKTGANLTIDHAVSIALQIAGALHYAHERKGPKGKPLNVVHRDVSPSNILISYDGSVKLLDFGVAKAASNNYETRAGALKGKITYMSPEQCKGGDIDRRSDIFSLGIVMWEMAVGRRLFKNSNELATIQAIINDPIPRPSAQRSGIHPKLEQIIMKALEKDRSARYQTSQELQLELEEYAREERVKLSTVGLGNYLQELFQSEVAAWKSADEKGITLAEHVLTSKSLIGTPSAIGSDEKSVSEIERAKEPSLKDDEKPSEPVEGAVAAKTLMQQPRAPKLPPVSSKLPPVRSKLASVRSKLAQAGSKLPPLPKVNSERATPAPTLAAVTSRATATPPRPLTARPNPPPTPTPTQLTPRPRPTPTPTPTPTPAQLTPTPTQLTPTPTPTPTPHVGFSQPEYPRLSSLADQTANMRLPLRPLPAQAMTHIKKIPNWAWGVLALSLAIIIVASIGSDAPQGAGTQESGQESQPALTAPDTTMQIDAEQGTVPVVDEPRPAITEEPGRNGKGKSRTRASAKDRASEESSASSVGLSDAGPSGGEDPATSVNNPVPNIDTAIDASSDPEAEPKFDPNAALPPS